MPKALKRLYIVENIINGEKSLVEASSSAQALNVIGRQSFKIRVPTTIEVATLVGGGMCPIMLSNDSEVQAPPKSADPVP